MTATVGSHIGQLAPEIDLPDGNGERWKLSDARGKPVVLFFYPGDETPVCTKQLCSVRDNWARYQATGAEVVGINTDSVEKHMEPPLPLVGAGEPLGAARNELEKNDAIMVVEDGKPVGVLTRADLLMALVD